MQIIKTSAIGFVVFSVIVLSGCLHTATEENVENSNTEATNEMGESMMEESVVDEDMMDETVVEENMMGDAKDTMMDADAKVFNVTGENFVFSTDEIVVSKGDTVVINFESTQGFHDWVIDEFDAKTEQVNPGTQTSVTFVADEAGTFEYYCSVGSHRAQGMVGTLTVQ